MGLSIQLFGLPADQYAPIVERAEALGFDTVWLADHVITPMTFAKTYPYKESGDPGYRPETPFADVAVTLGYLAARTRRIRLGTGVFVLPLRNPLLVARAWASLQNLSGGRAILGVGSGWMAEEFTAVGEDFGARGARLDEMLDVLSLLWSGAEVTYEGRFFRFPPVRFGGPPEQEIPIVVGGHSPVALRRAAHRAVGWFSPDVELTTALRMVRDLDQARSRAGRGELPFTHYVRLFGGVTAQNAAAYHEAGLRDLVFSPFTRLPAGATLGDRLGALEDVAGVLQPFLQEGVA
jgi:probable F420-dependent oxidoreductase